MIIETVVTSVHSGTAGNKQVSGSYMISLFTFAPAPCDMELCSTGQSSEKCWYPPRSMDSHESLSDMLNSCTTPLPTSFKALMTVFRVPWPVNCLSRVTHLSQVILALFMSSGIPDQKELTIPDFLA